MKFSFLLLIFLFSVFYLFEVEAQITKKSKPRFINDLKVDIPIIVLDEIDTRKLLKEDRKNERLGVKELRYAKIIEVDINTTTDGVWKEFANGDRVWSVIIKSPKAFSLGILFDNYRLPKGAELFIYSVDKSHIRGAFTYKNNKSTNLLAIAPIKGDEIVIEYIEPDNADFKGELNIASIAHDYKNVFKYLEKDTKGFGTSGNCNVNVNCKEGDDWQTIKQSVCKVTYNGWLCSGALINNTNEDGFPYFLTANHCISRSYDAEAAIFYFNYESPTCEDNTPVLDQTISGSTITATPSVKSLDFSLLELSVPPPPEYYPYYAGWNRDVKNPQKVTSIHHPDGDIKKITVSKDGAVTGNYDEGYTEFAHWYIDAWDLGTTEGGSSGSPLFDQNKLIIGDLTGGDASCSYNFNDYYAQFHRSWNEFGELNQQLKNWLDPKNTGQITLGGFQPYDTVPTNLKISKVDTIIRLSWNELIDSSNVDYYRIFKNNELFDSTDFSYFKDTVYTDSVNYYEVSAILKSPVKETVRSNKEYIRVMIPLTLPLKEDFEKQSSIPSQWYEERSNDTIGWLFQSGRMDGILDTAYEGIVSAHFFDFSSETSKLVLPRLNLSAYSNVMLSFYLHNQELNNDIHTLRVVYKESDTLDWKTIRSFNNDISEWTKVNIPLVNLSADYQIAIEGIGFRGFGICIDSLSVIEDLNFINPDVLINKDAICLNDSVEFSTNLDNSYSLEWNFGKEAIPENAIGPGPHKVKYTTDGIKPVSLTVNNTYLKHINDVVIVYDIPKPIYSQNGDVLTSNYEYGNQWYLDGAKIDGATNKTYKIEQDGDYYLEVTNSYNCFEISETKSLVVSNVNIIENLDQSEFVKIYPNPNNGSFKIALNKKYINEDIFYSIVDITGRVIQAGSIENKLNEDDIILRNIKEGIYLVKISSDKDYYTSKIIIKK